MKKVLFLVNHDIVIYNFRLEIVEKLLEENYQVYISSPYGERIDDLKKLGCKYIETHVSRHGTNIIEDFKLLLHYREIMKVIRPDVVLTFTIKPNIYGGMAARLLRIPYIANITGLGTAVEKEGILKKVTVQLYKVAFKKIKRVFFQNEENQQFFIDKKIALGRHKLLPGSGVNLERFPLLEYPDDKVVKFVFISRIMKEKGIDQYLITAEYIKERYPNTEFHICGFYEDDYEDIIRAYVDRNIIIYHGMIRDIQKIFKITHCTILPSFHEGMSNVLLESASSGRPIITTNISGCKEIVDENKSGYLIEVENSEQLIQNVIKVLNLTNKERAKMGKNGRDKMENEFNRKIVVNSYFKEIKN